MNSQEIDKLVTFIEENLRTSRTSGLSFVDTRRHRTRLLLRQNHVVFGRRGAGKTTLVNSTRDSTNHLDVYLNLEDYKDITFPNIVIQILVELFRRLERHVLDSRPWWKRLIRPRGTLRTLQRELNDLDAYLREPDEEMQQIRETKAYGSEISASVETSSASAGAKATRDAKREVRRELAKSKLDYLRIQLTTYKKLLQSISELFSDQPVFLILDDFYFVTKSIQPNLVDYFHRLTKDTALFLKIATIKHRSKLYRREPERYLGVEIGHDVFEIDMDYTLDKFEELQAFMEDLLTNAIVKSDADIQVSDIFAGGGLPQLCLASGGVPRDFLSLFVTLANVAASTGQQIGKVQVTGAAIGANGSKIESMKRDSGDDDAVLETLLSRIKHVVYDEKRTNAFLVRKDDLDMSPHARQAIRELVDLRLIHMVDQNTSKAPSDGRRYEAYILDVGLYDNSRPRSFTQVEPGQRDDRARKDQLRASPVFEVSKLSEPIVSQPRQMDMELSYE